MPSHSAHHTQPISTTHVTPPRLDPGGLQTVWTAYRRPTDSLAYRRYTDSSQTAYRQHTDIPAYIRPTDFYREHTDDLQTVWPSHGRPTELRTSYTQPTDIIHTAYRQPSV